MWTREYISVAATHTSAGSHLRAKRGRENPALRFRESFFSCLCVLRSARRTQQRERLGFLYTFGNFGIFEQILSGERAKGSCGLDVAQTGRARNGRDILVFRRAGRSCRFECGVWLIFYRGDRAGGHRAAPGKIRPRGVSGAELENAIYRSGGKAHEHEGAAVRCGGGNKKTKKSLREDTGFDSIQSDTRIRRSGVL